MTTVEQVRLVTGDGTVPYIFAEAEVQFFLDGNGNDVNLAGAAMMRAWAAKYAANADTEKIGDYSYSQKVHDNMLKLASTLMAAASQTPYMTWGEMDLVSTPTGEDS